MQQKETNPRIGRIIFAFLVIWIASLGIATGAARPIARNGILLQVGTGPHGVTLTWTPGVCLPNTTCAASSYNILRGTAAGAEAGAPIATVTPIAPATTPPTTYFDTTGTPGTTYFYEITATNSVGTSGPSNEVSATFLVPLVAPPPPTDLVAVPK